MNKDHNSEKGKVAEVFNPANSYADKMLSLSKISQQEEMFCLIEQVTKAKVKVLLWNVPYHEDGGGIYQDNKFDQVLAMH